MHDRQLCDDTLRIRIDKYKADDFRDNLYYLLVVLLVIHFMGRGLHLLTSILDKCGIEMQLASKQTTFIC